MTREMYKAGTGDQIDAALKMKAAIAGQGGLGGLWGLDHARPVNDAELRKAREVNGISQELDALSHLSGQRSMIQRLGQLFTRSDQKQIASLNRDLALLGPVERAVIGRDHWKNLVVNEGLAYILEAGIANEDTPDTTWFVGLIKVTSPTIVGADTMASHAGWTEAVLTTDYTGNRQAWVSNGVATGTTTKTISNSSSVVAFAILTTFVASGALLTADATGTTGILYAAGEYSGGDRSVQNGDTLEIQADFTATDDGV